MNEIIPSEVLRKHGFHVSRMICGSKSGYRKRHPESVVIFNANIVTSKGKVWYGDLDLTLDYKKLQKVSRELEEPLYVLQEFACRFDTEIEDVEVLKSRAAYIVHPDKDLEKVQTYMGFTSVNGEVKLF